MDNEYDFTNAVQGKFYSPDAEFHHPIYLTPEIESLVLAISEQKR